MQKNETNFKALTFLAEQTASTFNFEVKGVRALWDPSLSIPGTNRRGGWRCPVGTRYGGQITDRFGRSCGWGIARRIANQIADIGERLENIDDRKRNNRLAKRNARVQRFLARQNKPGLLERGARNIADALDGDEKLPRQIKPSARPSTPTAGSPKPDTPKKKRKPRRKGNLRESEARRMERELEQPGAPRTGEPPKPNKQRRRRRTATQQGAKRTARRKPEADFVDGAQPEKPIVAPRRVETEPKPIVIKPDSDFVGETNPDSVGEPDLGDSLPDERSLRNVRNRFPKNGLPNNAYWRETNFPEGEEKNELERRFGRYYDGDGELNDRGDYVNRKLKDTSDQPGQPQANMQTVVIPKQPNFEMNEWEKIEGIERWKKGDWEIQLLPQENGLYAGLEAINRSTGEVVRDTYEGPQGKRALNSHLDRFEAKLTPQKTTTDTPDVTPPSPEAPDSLPASRVVPDIDAGRGNKTPRRYGKESDRQRAIKLLHEQNGNLSDVPDGVVIEAVIDEQFKWVVGGGGAGQPVEYDDAKIAEALKYGFKEGQGAIFENRRFLFIVLADKNDHAPGPWQVLKIKDKVSGEFWFMKTSTYGRNDALLENIGMRAAQDLEFGNNENHLRVGALVDGPPTDNGQPMPVRWMMMRDVAQWENGVQGNWQDADRMTEDQAKKVNPRDVARILALDFVFDNTDRHGGNFLMAEVGGRVRLAIIDNGLLFGGRLLPGDGRSNEEHAALIQRKADEIVSNPSLRGYLNEQANNPFDELEELKYKFQNDRDRNIYKKTMRRSLERLRDRLDDILSVERIEANGIKLSDWEKNHLAQVRRVAEARIAWGLTHLDEMAGNF